MEVIILLVLLPALAHGHASLIEPPSRASMNLYGFPQNPVDYQHNEGFCGGFSHQFSPAIGGRCGICGDAWDANPRHHEAPGGKFANGIITRSYQPGAEIEVKVLVTANHKGYFTFRLCRNNDVSSDPKQDCFEETESLLQVVPSGEYRFPVTTAMSTGELGLRLRLPAWECTQCILQWTYTAGNSWGTCPDGSGGLGCGPQENFRSCSDISLSGTAAVLPSLPPPSPPPVSSSPATLAPATGAPWTAPAPSAGQTCVAVGAWAGDSGMAAWCLSNCFAPTPYCPTDRCDCIASAPAQTTAVCQAVGAWTGDASMSAWCTTNCNHNPPYCPPAQCSCGDTTQGTHATASPQTSPSPQSTSPHSTYPQPPVAPANIAEFISSLINQLISIFISFIFGVVVG